MPQKSTKHAHNNPRAVSLPGDAWDVFGRVAALRYYDDTAGKLSATAIVAEAAMDRLPAYRRELAELESALAKSLSARGGPS